MIYDEDPFRRRPRESTARRKRHERCVWMARKMTEWPSKRGPITKIRPSDGCGKDAVTLAVERWYDLPELGVIREMSAHISQQTGFPHLVPVHLNHY